MKSPWYGDIRYSGKGREPLESGLYSNQRNEKGPSQTLNPNHLIETERDKAAELRDSKRDKSQT